MEFSLVLNLALALTLVLLSAFFSGSEAALFSLSEIQLRRMEERGVPAVRKIRDLLARPRRVLIAILTGNEFVNVAISALAGAAGVAIGLPSYGVIGGTTLLLMILCGVFPKAGGRRWPERWSGSVARPLAVFVYLTFPIRWGLERVVALLARGPAPAAGRARGVREDEFLMLVGLGLREGALRAEEGRLIEAVFDLGDAQVGRLMTPRTEMFALPRETTLRQALAVLEPTPYSRVPVYGEDLDDIRGILRTADAIREVVRGGGERTVEEICRRPVYVPEQKRVSDLFRLFRRKRIHMAVVVDEYGGVAGVVTLDDVLVELFGEIRDEHDRTAAQDAVIVSEGIYQVEGRMLVEDFNAFVGAEIQPGENETIAGVVFSRLGHLPKAGEIVSVDGYVFKVLEMDGTRIARLRVTRETRAGS